MNKHYKSHNASIQWDEVTIAEHDKERGTRQKVILYFTKKLFIYI